VIGYSKLTGDSSHDGCLAATFAAAQRQHAGFINDYYDDNAWWALAWVAAFDMTRDSRYLDVARTIFTHNTGAWDDTCRGGLWWNRSRNYKNAITNELFLAASVKLDAITHSQTPVSNFTYLGWAQAEWAWLNATSMLQRSTGLYLDGLVGCSTTQTQGAYWSYNQGVLLDGLAGLADATGDDGLRDMAWSVASTAMNYYSVAGPQKIMAELACGVDHGDQGWCNGPDGQQFKGAFVRHLAYAAKGIAKYQPSRLTTISTWLSAQAASLLANGSNSNGATTLQLGQLWQGPWRANAPDAWVAQNAGVDVLLAAAQVVSLL